MSLLQSVLGNILLSELILSETGLKPAFESSINAVSLSETCESDMLEIEAKDTQISCCRRLSRADAFTCAGD